MPNPTTITVQPAGGGAAITVSTLDAILGVLPAALAANGGLKVEGVAGGVAVPVSNASLPLPTGASTAANQATEITSLATIATNTTGASTAALQTTGNNSLASILTACQAATPAGTNTIGKVTALADTTAATNSTLISPVVLATTVRGTAVTLDLRSSYSAALLTVRLGRRGSTAPSSGAYVLIRRSLDGTIQAGNRDLDRVGNTTTAASTTVSSGGASGTNTVVVASNTGLAVGDTIAVASDDANATRFQTRVIMGISGTTITVDQDWSTSLVAADRLTNCADVWHLRLDRGWHYTINVANISAGSVLAAVEANTLP